MSAPLVSTDDEQRLHPWSWLFVLQQQIQQLLLPLVALLVFGSRRQEENLFYQWAPLIVVVALVATALLQYLTYRYRISTDRLIIRSGIFERTRREIPFARIHNVVVHQSLLHRLFGVAELRLESAAGDKPEAQMRVLKLAQALELEQLIRQRGDVTAGEGDAPPPNDELLALRLPELVRLGLISNRAMVVVAAAIGALYQMLPRDITENFIEQQGKQAVGYASQLHLGTTTLVASGVALLVTVLLLMWLMSIGLAIVQYHGFRLSEADQRLTVERGLLTRLRSSVARRRIQAWTLREGALHRLFGRRQLRVDIASGGGNEEKQGRALKELAPLATPDACDGLLQHLLPQLQWPPSQWHAVSTRGWWRLCLPALVVTSALAALLTYETGPWGLLPLLWLPWSAFKAHRQVTRMAYNIDAQRVAVRGGWWNRWWRIAELDKLQALRLDRSPLDRRFGTATLTLDTAGALGAPALQLRFLEEQRARELMEQLGREMARRKLRW
ncbi:membrane protein [Stenotrophomonas humi]|uniref:Membrane protein n=1 Tax=Stenotrophomonas humi TaxID=405444 RepID=A0A0R0CKC1_9GAMM|nr:PH domain-containing protein [Stenotrophomonas humi]KRG65635.1 membrane protein [Stenotrophomonas humi]